MAKVKREKKAAKGKWGHLVGVLPRLTHESATEQEQIEMLRKQIIADYQEEHPDAQHPPTAVLVDQYLALRDAKDRLKSQLSGVELELKTLTRMIDEKYDEEGLSSLHTSDGASVGRHFEPHAVVVDHSKLREWAEKNGLGERLTLPWPTVNAEVKAALESGTAVYDGEKLVGGPEGVDVFIIAKFQRRGQ